jgi:5-oxoprolinase (ATP-hydrolysing) subunit A
VSRTSIDLNADVGEGFATDAELIPLVSSVNIACGAHAGDEKTMREAVTLAFRHGVAIGAHPGFEDRENFGRREVPISPEAAAKLVVEQTKRLQVIAESLGAEVGHVKLHGALYNMASRDRALATAIAKAVLELSLRLSGPSVVYALAGSPFIGIGREMGLRMVGEAFAERSYQDDGTLTPRSMPGALLGSVEAVTAQALEIAREGGVFAVSGAKILLDAETICLHGDSSDAVASAREIRNLIRREGVGIARL